MTGKCISLKLARPINILEPVHASQYHCAFKEQAIPPPVCLKKIWFSRKSRRACASQSSGGAQSTKSCLGGTELCKAQNCSKHKIVQSTKMCKNQNCAKHKIVQRTKLCKAQICAKHKLVQSTKLFKACVQYLNTCCVQIGALSIV